MSETRAKELAARLGERRTAHFAIIGFAAVMFTFFGVTYLLPGLHAYA